MKQYPLAAHMVEGDEPPEPEAIQQAYRAVEALNTELQAEGAWVFAGGLDLPTTATVVRVRDGDVVTTDGPFAQTKEHLGGFWVIRAADLDAALGWAGKATKACGAPVKWFYLPEGSGTRMRWIQDFRMRPEAPIDTRAMTDRINENTAIQMRVIKDKVETAARERRRTTQSSNNAARPTSSDHQEPN